MSLSFPLAVAAALAAAPATGEATAAPPGSQPRSVTLTPVEMFVLADRAARKDDLATAEAVYRALATNPAVEIRSEARFRLAMLLASKRRLTDAALLLRAILDEQPNAQRVRIELAGVLAMMGDESAARRELRAAQAGTLPPEVAQMIDRFSAALRARKPFGGSLQVAIASDSNVNRATRSDTVGTVIGDFVLNEDAQARSGKGLSLEGQIYGRLPLNKDHALLATLSGAGDFYRKSRFNDVTLNAKVGPELQLGKERVNLRAGVRRRWFGGDRLSTAVGGQIDVARPLTPVSQIRAFASGDRVRHHRNPAESGWMLVGSAVVETALSQQSGVGIGLSGIRQALRSPGYSTTSGQATLFGYRELGKTTVSVVTSLARLEADERLLLFPERRREWLARGMIGATWRQIVIAGFAPTIEFVVERNRSSIEIYDYRRAAIEFGITRAF